MKYFSVHPSNLESQEFLSASNDQIATWLLLHAFCSKQLNSGTITDADNLPDRFWMRHGINLDVVKADSPLWEWDGPNVTIGFYDLDGQELYQKKVEAGKSHGRGRGKSTPNRTANSTPKSSPHSTPDREENRGEENRGEDRKGEKKKSSSDDREVSNDGLVFADWFKTLLPETVSLPKNWKKSFADTYDKMIGIDKRTPDQIRTVCEWGRTNSFWQNIIMSPTKLRERKDGIMYFDKLMAQATPAAGPSRKPTIDELVGGRKYTITKASDIKPTHRELKAAMEFPEPRKPLPRL